MKPNETVQDALRRLRQELEQHRIAGGPAHVAHHAAALPGVSALLAHVPLVHGVNDLSKFKSALKDGELRAGTVLGRAPWPSELYFDLGNVVYTAAGVLYPDRQFALILTPDVEDGRRAEASPWDSGAFYKSLCEHLPPATDGDRQRRDAFVAHTLPAPTYRAYLLDYVTTHFASGSAYLTPSTPHLYQDALNAINDRFTSRVFEVRFSEPIPLASWSVEMIFVPRMEPRESLALRKALGVFWKHNKVTVYRGGTDTLHDVARKWIFDKLAHEGGSHG